MSAFQRLAACFSIAVGLYRRWRSEPIGRELTTAFAIWFAVPVLPFLLAFITKTTQTFSRAVTIGWIGSTVALLGAWRLGLRAVLHFARTRGRNTKNVAFLGSTSISERLAVSLE